MGSFFYACKPTQRLSLHHLTPHRRLYCAGLMYINIWLTAGVKLMLYTL
ncbi:hypothetical protein ETA_24360 [Erwinia tasmaniensis Et1/99]|uniref:Uncharacterized protein n=1 Tax=Erwinia tasmaniensis (strain DSM 17950 / CFBP 7177 / CIP 109463 / NCPPB 4357 / Et1/99) TaxID=465817 RepID=B2VBD3_ERWT9|nr:hypothetical protein ETA_24360 [Erwinia tasmaniensis Et1/99]